jgi:hypothetical protein
MKFDLKEYPADYFIEDDQEYLSSDDIQDDQEYLSSDDIQELISDSHFSFDDCYDDINLDENPF